MIIDIATGIHQGQLLGPIVL